MGATPPTDAELCEGVRSGDRDAAEAIVRRHRPLVLKLVRRYRKPPGIDAEDMVQVGMLALLRAARKFDPSRAKYGTVAWVTVSNELSRWVTEQLRQTRLTCGPEGLDSAPARPGPESGGLAAALSALPPTLREVVSITYGLEGNAVGTYNAGLKLGLTRRQVEALLAQAAELLRGRLDGEGYRGQLGVGLGGDVGDSGGG